MTMMKWINNYLLDTGCDPCSENVVKPMFDMKPQDNGPLIWAIGGGKGGVGKSLISSNFGHLLSKRGYKVLLVDADFGAANLHSFFKTEKQIASLSTYLKDADTGINNVICRTTIPNLDLISGANDLLDVADIGKEALYKFISEIKKTNYDYVVLDVGPGTASKMLDLMLMSDSGVLISSPDPTSIENTYRFLKSLCLRKMKHIINSGEDKGLSESLLKAIGKGEQDRARTFVEIFDRLRSIDDESGTLLQSIMGGLQLSILINQVKREKDQQLGRLMSHACDDYFGINVKSLGYVEYEVRIAEAIQDRKLLSLDFGHSDFGNSINECFLQLIEDDSVSMEEKVA